MDRDLRAGSWLIGHRARLLAALAFTDAEGVRQIAMVSGDRRSVAERIGRESVLVGMGLSLMAMGVAAFGYLPPVAGALLQEGIDLAVILNALRALRG
jgi:cation transport ATPase